MDNASGMKIIHRMHSSIACQNRCEFIDVSSINEMMHCLQRSEHLKRLLTYFYT